MIATRRMRWLRSVPARVRGQVHVAFYRGPRWEAVREMLAMSIPWVTVIDERGECPDIFELMGKARTEVLNVFRLPKELLSSS